VAAAYAFHQNVPPAPGRQPTGEVQPQPAPAPGGPAPGGHPQGEPPGMTGLLPLFIMLVPLLLFMFWSSRSQQKKQEKVLSSLTKGDRIIVQGGLIGKFVEMNDRLAKIEIAPGVKIDVLRSGILGKDSPETQAAAEKK
jgi:preprotein translocase subunit YajC